ncbi:LysR family transcriptional regulator [Kordiimonas gwangyangensis]|uniref:LysR family transcriptional regulator n=2 Tax=Kordiimonas gwangyangensis TaxID=288022 RepID=UPI00037DBB32|nr:LysR family transcriptional regulator [Kordiimonas gwangyangensis]
MDSVSRLKALPNLTALKAFDALVRSGSVSRAADALGVTPGAVSRQVKQLEEELGFALFDRSGGKLTLSPGADDFAASIAGAFDQMAMATTTLKAEVRQNELVIACSPSFHFCWLLARLPSFEAAHRDIRVVVHTALSTHAATTQPDAIIGVGHWPTDGRLRQRGFMELHSGPVMAPALAARISPAGPPLANIRHLRLRRDSTIWRDWYEDAGVPPADAPDEAAFDHLFLTIEAARAGLGAAIAPYAYVADDIATGLLAAPFGFLERKVPYHIAWAGGIEPKAALRVFTEWLVEEGRRTPQPKKS